MGVLVKFQQQRTATTVVIVGVSVDPHVHTALRHTHESSGRDTGPIAHSSVVVVLKDGINLNMRTLARFLGRDCTKSTLGLGHTQTHAFAHTHTGGNISADIHFGLLLLPMRYFSRLPRAGNRSAVVRCNEGLMEGMEEKEMYGLKIRISYEVYLRNWVGDYDLEQIKDVSN